MKTEAMKLAKKKRNELLKAGRIPRPAAETAYTEFSFSMNRVESEDHRPIISIWINLWPADNSSNWRDFWVCYDEITEDFTKADFALEENRKVTKEPLTPAELKKLVKELGLWHAIDKEFPFLDREFFNRKAGVKN